MSKTKKVLLIHGWGGKKDHHWLTWIEKQLLMRGDEVCFPQIPNKYNPNQKKWTLFIKEEVKNFQPDIVIAHSLGALTWWHFYHQNDYQLEQLICVSPPTFSSFPSKMSTFFPLPTIKFNQGVQTIIYALDDPNIDEKLLRKLAKNMNSDLIEKESGEHLDHFSKTVKLSEVLEIVS